MARGLAADKMRPLRYYEPPILASTCKFLCENTADKPTSVGVEKMHGADAAAGILVAHRC